MITRYLDTLDFREMAGMQGMYVVDDGNQGLLFCAYKDRDLHKQSVVKLTNRISNLKTSLHDWEFHHIIERQHVADIPLYKLGLGYLSHYYRNEIPTVMLNKAEHKKLSSYFHFKEFRQLYTRSDRDIAPKAALREQLANSNYSGDRAARRDLAILLDNMADMYANAYCDHPVFEVISNNFFKDIKQAINR